MILLTLISVFCLVISIRLVYIVLTKGKPRYFDKNPARTLIVIGSGGHTTELLRQVKKLRPNLYRPRLYIMANSDTSSEAKISAIEEQFKGVPDKDFVIKKLPRSRHVNQSYITSVVTTLYAILKSIPTMYQFRPDLILCNGPGTCIPICIIAFIMNVLFISHTSIIFLESICRVETLSLSGKILLLVADKVLVQWPQLHDKYPRTLYIGQLL